MSKHLIRDIFRFAKYILSNADGIAPLMLGGFGGSLWVFDRFVVSPIFSASDVARIAPQWVWAWLLIAPSVASLVGVYIWLNLPKRYHLTVHLIDVSATILNAAMAALLMSLFWRVNYRTTALPVVAVLFLVSIAAFSIVQSRRPLWSFPFFGRAKS